MNNYLYNYMNQLNQNNFYKNDNNNLFDPYNAFIRGNLFKNLYDTYKNNEPYEIRPINEQASLLTKINSLCFTLKDLNLYLDIYPDSREMINLYNQSKGFHETKVLKTSCSIISLFMRVDFSTFFNGILFSKSQNNH